MYSIPNVLRYVLTPDGHNCRDLNECKGKTVIQFAYLLQTVYINDSWESFSFFLYKR